MSTSRLSPEELALACADAMWRDDPASQALGMRLSDIRPGQATVSMRITRQMLNGHATCHGGFIFSLADSAFAFACNTYNQRTVAQHCSITYLAPAFEGDELIARATETHRTARSGLYDVHVTNQKSELIAAFRGHSRTIKGTHLPTTTDVHQTV
ncbi:MAG: hydroxyphenylacetyl-CoA thioesterase PaaI [Lautropia sp.]|nr:hydroxyphenylacetyl-CoA thioesterase PaaI [Lautropia sp.]